MSLEPSVAFKGAVGVRRERSRSIQFRRPRIIAALSRPRDEFLAMICFLKSVFWSVCHRFSRPTRFRVRGRVGSICPRPSAQNLGNTFSPIRFFLRFRALEGRKGCFELSVVDVENSLLCGADVRELILISPRVP